MRVRFLTGLLVAAAAVFGAGFAMGNFVSDETDGDGTTGNTVLGETAQPLGAPDGSPKLRGLARAPALPDLRVPQPTTQPPSTTTEPAPATTEPPVIEG